VAVTVNTSGLMSTSGFDVQGLVDQMIQAAQAPELLWKDQKTALAAQASALQSLSSKLTSLNSNVQALNDVLGVFAQHTVSSSDQSVVTATATEAAAVGQHTVIVSSLASKAVYYSETSVASGDTVLSGGSVTLISASSSHQIAIGADTNTLDLLAAKINSYEMGVTASVLNDSSGARLAVVSGGTGTINDITLTTSSDSALTFVKSSDGANAKASFDGIPIESATNSLDNVVPGVSIQLKSKSPDNAVTIDIAFDTQRVGQAINDLVNSYNSLLSATNAQFAFDPGSGSSGPLAGDAALRTLQEQLMWTIGNTKVPSNPIPTLRSLGIAMNDDGTLTVDNDKLNALLSSQFQDVKTFFQTPGNGFGTQLGELMDDLTDSVNGPLVVDLKGISASEQELTNTINDFEDRLTLKRQQLVDQFSQVNALLQSLPSMQNEIDAMLGTMSNNQNE
jgi:flagellar hook-associated protein 2